MADFDVFNGDADGLCALHQLRLDDPRESVLITGAKRDIALLERVPAKQGDSVTVLDISMDVNRASLLDLLARGVNVQYFDHHGSGQIPDHARLSAHIDTTPDVCTAILVDRWLKGKFRIWAVVAAFGDNFAHSAQRLAQSLPLSDTQLAALQELGICLNYNAYGDSEDDLVIHPASLYGLLRQHADPFRFMAEEPVFQKLREAHHNDMEMARQALPFASLPCGKIAVLPDAPWSRRVRGAYGNFLATNSPDQAHAILTPDGHNGYVVSVRSPLAVMRGADHVCAKFPGGGGRPAAAGIGHLPEAALPEFVQAFEQVFTTISRA